MFFRKKYCGLVSEYKVDPIESLRISQTDIYDKKGKDGEIIKTERTLQYKRVDGSWEDVWTHWNSPVFLESKNG